MFRNHPFFHSFAQKIKKKKNKSEQNTKTKKKLLWLAIVGFDRNRTA